jgi:hypothetical protein
MKKLIMPRHFWLGFWVMLIAYTLIRMFFYDGVLPAPQWLKEQRQLVRWCNISLIYVVGILIIKKMKEPWMLWAWNAVHLLLIAYLLLAAVFEKSFGGLPYGIRASVAPIIEFLISPAYYVALALLYAFHKKMSPETESETD